MELEKHTPFHHPGHRELEKHRTLAVTREGKKLDGRHTGCIRSCFAHWDTGCVLLSKGNVLLSLESGIRSAACKRAFPQ